MQRLTRRSLLAAFGAGALGGLRPDVVDGRPVARPDDSPSPLNVDDAFRRAWTERISHETIGVYDIAGLLPADDGGYVYARETAYERPGDNYLRPTLVCVNADGTERWRRRYGDEPVTRRVEDVVRTTDGGYLLVGRVNRDERYYAWRCKTDGRGAVEWATSDDVPRDQYWRYTAVHEPVVGRYLCFALRYYDGRPWVVLVDEDGTRVGERRLDVDGSLRPQATTEVGEDILLVADRDDGDIELVRLGADGKLLADSTLSLPTTTLSYANVDSDGTETAVVAWGRDDTTGRKFAFALGVDDSDEERWRKRYRGDGVWTRLNAVEVLPTDDVLVAGSRNTMAGTWVLCLAADGVERWRRHYGPQAYGDTYGIVAGAGNEYVLAGNASNHDSPGADIWTMGLRPANLSPTGSLVVRPTTPRVGDAVTFDASGATDSDGHVVGCHWRVDGDDELTGRRVEYRFSTPGDHWIRLTVSDDVGSTDVVDRTVSVEPDGTAVRPSGRF